MKDLHNRYSILLGLGLAKFIGVSDDHISFTLRTKSTRAIFETDIASGMLSGISHNLTIDVSKVFAYNNANIVEFKPLAGMYASYLFKGVFLYCPCICCVILYCECVGEKVIISGKAVLFSINEIVAL